MKKPACVGHLMSRAFESMEAANELLLNRHYGFSAARAYYAMFYAAEAALLHRDLQFAKHSAVISFFNKEFVKSGVFPAKMSASIRNAHGTRITGNYGPGEVSEEEAREVLAEAKDFVSEVSRYLRTEGYEIGRSAESP